MPVLEWDPVDVMACLEVEPWTEEYETEYRYQLEKDGLRLDLSVRPFGSSVEIVVHREGIERPLFSFRIMDSSGVHYVNDQRGEYLEFGPSQVIGDFRRGYLMPATVRLSVKPHISIEFLDPPQ